jgi:hypothetical protein
MLKRNKALVVGALSVAVVLLAVFVWIQTKVLVVTLLLLVGCAAALVFVVRKL